MRFFNQKDKVLFLGNYSSSASFNACFSSSTDILKSVSLIISNNGLIEGIIPECLALIIIENNKTTGICNNWLRHSLCLLKGQNVDS